MKTQCRALQGAARCSAAALWVVFALTALTAHAAEPSGRDIAEHGTGAAPACASCHGVAGQGMAAAGFPRLAGQNATYLTDQLTSFGNGTRNNAVMSAVAKGIDRDQARAIAAYYAALPAPPESAAVAAAAPTAVDAPTTARGRLLAQQGDWSKGLPACAQCHGSQGLGVGSAFPGIAGQPASYLAAQLQAWQQGTRSNDPLGLMRSVTAHLSASEIEDVAAYYASLAARPRISAPQQP